MNVYMILLATVLMLFSEYLFLLRGEATHNLQILNLTKQFFELHSIFVLLIAVGMFGVFSMIQIGSIGWINYISSGTFGVYLIHDNPIVRQIIWSQVFHAKEHLLLNPWKFALWAFAVVFIVYIGALVIELIRKFIFEFARKQIGNRRNEKGM